MRTCIGDAYNTREAHLEGMNNIFEEKYKMDPKKNVHSVVVSVEALVIKKEAHILGQNLE